MAGIGIGIGIGSSHSKLNPNLEALDRRVDELDSQTDEVLFLFLFLF
jgi:hypothetical protein